MAADEDFIKELIKHRGTLFAYILAAAGDFHTAEDLLQEVSVTAFQKADTFTSGTNFGAWIRAIARRKLLEEFRRRKRTALPLDEDVMTRIDSEFDRTEQTWEAEKEALQHCLDRTPERMRHMIRLRYGDARSMESIAAVLRSSAGAVQVALSRTRQALLECIEQFVKNRKTV